MPFLEIVALSKEVLSLASELDGLIREARDAGKHDPSISQLLDQLRARASAGVEGFSRQLRGFLAQLKEWNIAPDRSLESLFEECKWYNWITRSHLRSLRETVLSYYRILSGLVDDITALLACGGQGARAGSGFRAALETHRRLDTVLQKDVPVGKLLHEMLAVADETYLSLRG